ASMDPSSTAAPVAALGDDKALGRPLCVNLNGTLVLTDVLWESALRLLRKRPWLVFLLPLWMLGGRARLERAVAAWFSVDAAALPYRTDLVEMLRQSAEKGRRIVLCAAGDHGLAQAVAKHLELFHEVLPIEGPAEGNGAATRKLLEERFGAAGFDYVGASAAELPVM